MRSIASPGMTLAALGVSIGSFASLQSLLVPVLPTMQVDLGTDGPGITWALTIWLIVAAVATPLLGRVGDLVGKRRIFLLALAAVAVGSIVSALAPNLAILLVGRALQGLAGAIFPLGFGLVRDVLPAHRVPGGIGILSALMAVGSGIGTVFAGPVAEFVGWRGLFVFPLVGVLVGAALARIGVPDVAVRASGRINALSALLLTGWLVALLIPLSLGSTWGWGSPGTIGLLALAAVLLTAWILNELRTDHPLVDMRMMRLPGVWSTNLAAIFVGAAMFGVWTYFSRFLQEPTSTGYGLGESVSSVGIIMLPMLLLMAVVGFFTGPLTRVVSPRAQLIGGTAIAAVSIASIAAFHEEAWQLTLSAAFFGLGLGIAYAAMTTVVVQSVPATQTGIASGMNSNLRTIGSALGTAVATAIVSGSTVQATGRPSETGYDLAFVVLAALALAAAVVAAATAGLRGTVSDETTEELEADELFAEEFPELAEELRG